MSEFAQKLEEVMNERNFHIKGSIKYGVIGKFQRFPDGSKSKRRKDLFVVLHGYERGATFGDWHYPEDWHTFWINSYNNPTLAKIRERKIELIKIMGDQKYERAKAEWRAQTLWTRFYVSHLPQNHPYIIRKQIVPHYARQVRSWLLVPVFDIDHNLRTLQIIKPDGFKRLWKGTSQKELMIWLSPQLNKFYSGVIRICEGYATGCTIHQVTKSPVVCAINSTNLERVAILVRRKFVRAEIKICADNDIKNLDNVGVKCGMKAAQITGAKLYYPQCDNNLNISDFNDLLKFHGFNALKEQLKIERTF
jgi:putative DNA primase/helicase